MFDFLEWYFPWAELDGPLKFMAIAWLVSIGLGLLIFVYAVLLKKPWLSMQHLRAPSDSELSEDRDQGSSNVD